MENYAQVIIISSDGRESKSKCGTEIGGEWCMRRVRLQYMYLKATVCARQYCPGNRAFLGALGSCVARSRFSGACGPAEK